MKRVVADDLPTDPLAAARMFHRSWVPPIENALVGDEDVMIVFAHADHTHRAWRSAVTADLARAHAPRRVNAVAGRGPMIDAVADYLAAAPGITGQYLDGDAEGAGEPVRGA